MSFVTRRCLLNDPSARLIQFGCYHRSEKCAPTFHPEFGRFMLEATPGAPWGIGFKDLLAVESDMRWR